MNSEEIYNYRIQNSSRQVVLNLSEEDFKAFNLWHISASNNDVPPDFETFIICLARRYLQLKIDETPASFQARMLMLVKGRDPFAADSEIEEFTGFKFNSWKRGVFKVNPSYFVWSYIGLGPSLGWGTFKPIWKK